MEDTNCLVEESTKGVIKGVKDIHFAKKYKKGVYFMKSKLGEDIGVYKPKEEEEFLRGEGKEGDKADREVAAFLLDHPLMGKEEEGLGRVPPTTMVRVKNLHGDGSWTSGSLQEFIPNQPWWPRSPNGESFSMDDVQRMSLIDIRFGNNDRHRGNILNSNTNGGRLTPIDHGECFPKTSDTHSFLWTGYQAKHAYPSEMVKYVEDLDADKDLEILKCNGINLDEDSLKRYKIRTRVLKTGVAKGYLPAEIGQFVTKKVHVGWGKIKPKHISDLIEDCNLRQKRGEIEDDEKFYEEIGKGTEEALEFNKRNAPV